MDQIGIASGDNIGSMLALRLIPADAIVSIPAPDANRTINSPIISSEYSDMYFTPETLGWNEKSKLSKSGVVWESKIQFEIPRNRPDVSLWINTYIYKDLVAIVMDGNQVLNIIGDKDCPVKFDTVEADRDKKVAGGNQMTFNMICQQQAPSLFSTWNPFAPVAQNSNRTHTSAFTRSFT